MNKPSTFNLSVIPPIDNLKKLCKAISTLDAIISPEWEYRYFSYQNNWDKELNEECMEMRNGSGDYFFVLFTKDGAIINGQAHESEMCHWENVAAEKGFFQKLFGERQPELKQNIWKGVVDNVPKQFQHFIFGEPIKSKGTTFCIWNEYADNEWKKGDFVYSEDDYKDGSEDLMFILDNNPITYHSFAVDYYEEFDFDPKRLDINLVKHMYKHDRLTKDIVIKLNPNLTDFDKLKNDLDEIGYPYTL
jgi:hypothetical protein